MKKEVLRLCSELLEPQLEEIPGQNILRSWNIRRD